VIGGRAVGRLFTRPTKGRTVVSTFGVWPDGYQRRGEDDDKDAGRPGRVMIGRADLRGCGVGVLLFGACPQKSVIVDPYGSSDVVGRNPLRFGRFKRTYKRTVRPLVGRVNNRPTARPPRPPIRKP
jgi:hypothetical protein